MTAIANRRRPVFFFLVSLLFLAGTWFYFQRVLIGHQIADAAAHDSPRGNLSDLYPRWLGARELLLHGRDPYSPDITREIQVGYYGRALDPARSGDPKDQQGFAYPAFVVFYLAPTVHLPFDTVRKGFFWILLGLTALSVPLWLRTLRWPQSAVTQASIVALTLGSAAVMQGVKLQQITLFVAALIAVAISLLVSGHQIPAGFLLGLATMKPQIIFALVLWLAIWVSADFKRRYRLLIPFLITVAILVVGADILLPHWISRFLQAAREYQTYTGAVPLLDELISVRGSRLLELAVGIAAIYICWRNRRHSESSSLFAATTCMMLSVTLLIVPTYALYNQVLLLPSLVLLARDRQGISRRASGRVLLAAVALLLIWPWVSSTVLAALSFFLSPKLVQSAWAVPAWTVLTLPVAVSALMLLVSYRQVPAGTTD